MESTHEKGQSPIKPVHPVAAYIGGKRNLSERLCALIERVPHATYAEAFVGMGGVFLRRASRPRVEVINDISKDVSGLFRILQHHYVAFMDVLRWQITSRAEFERLLKVEPDTLTDLQRAARFLYLQRLTFGGKVNGRVFGVDARSPGRFDVNKLGPLLEDVHERLSSVVIESLHYADFISRYDKPETLFYLDPPYWKGETDYGKGVFARDDFQRLSDLLQGLKGQFVLSINDVPEIREIFHWADFDEVEHTFVVGGGDNAIPAYELIIKSQGVAGIERDSLL